MSAAPPAAAAPMPASPQLLEEPPARADEAAAPTNRGLFVWSLVALIATAAIVAVVIALPAFRTSLSAALPWWIGAGVVGALVLAQAIVLGVSARNARRGEGWLPLDRDESDELDFDGLGKGALTQ